VVTLGSLLADTPHTRPVRITGTVGTSDLAHRLGLSQSRYEGPTGIVGVLHDALLDAAIPSASLWATVPHYVGRSPSPAAALALLERALPLIGVTMDLGPLRDDAAQYLADIDEAVMDDDEARAYVRSLEEQLDAGDAPDDDDDVALLEGDDLDETVALRRGRAVPPRSRRRALRRAMAVAGAVAALAVARPAAAVVIPGCAEAPPIAEVVATANVAFIGTVAAVTDEEREATVDVTRVWKGGPLPSRVHVRGNVATQAKVHTALDKTYAQGAQYLFLPTAGASPSFAETACSSTALLSSELAALAPAGGGDPPVGGRAPGLQRDDDDSATRYVPLAIGGAAFVGLAVLLGLARRRSRALHNP
jgi:hypothetical protein